ncbi:MAG TPA: class I SAM-dependent methyltransferase [Thermoplasmata archaeon]|nr:class I SAM-dependent methyltransferase [Thermoplasmata archaeon]
MPRVRRPDRPKGYRSRPGKHVRHNQVVWDRVSAWYERHCSAVLGGPYAASWGMFRLPERELHLLGRVRGQRVLEVGCGAARWSMALQRQGAHATGIDLSGAQLAKARQLQRRARVRFPLVHGSVEQLPFPDASFDVVFCDWGGLTFSDPRRSVPECSRVLRRGGRFVFATASPIRNITLDARADRQVPRLVRPYFGSGRLDLGPNDTIEFCPPYGVWIDLFRQNGLAIDRLVETRPFPGQGSKYLSRSDARWARSWPMEAIWKLTKE